MTLPELQFGLAPNSSRSKTAAARRAQREARSKRLRLENLETRDLMATLTWDGNGGNGRNIVWSAFNNWNPTGTPQNGDSLVFSGTRKLTNVNDLSLSLNNVVINANGFNIDGNAINLAAGGLHFVGGANANWSIPLAISSTETAIEVYGSRTLTISDNIYGSGGIGKYGIGTALLNAATSFTGSTVLHSGVLRLNHANALAGSTLVYNNDGGAISFGSITAATIGGLTGGQDLVLQNANGAAVVLSVGANNQSTTYSGVLSGNGGLTKVGSGVLSLSGANAFAGTTTINSGILALNGSLTSGVVLAGGTLKGNGTVGNLALNLGLLTPGDGIGTFTATNGASLTGGVLALQMNDGVTFDQFVVTGGNVSLGSVLVTFAEPNFHAEIGDVLPIVNNTGAGSLSGIFLGMPDGGIVTVGGEQFTIRYGYDFGDDGNANDVVLIRTQGHPTAVNDSYTVAEDGTLTVNAPGVLANDLNPEDEVLTPTLFSGPEHGTVTFSPDGKFVYKPSPDFYGNDAMIYEIIDSQGGVLRGTVNLKVTAVNDAPVVGQNNLFKTASSVPLNGTLKASDVDGPTLRYSLVSQPASGSVSLNANGKFVYTPGAAGTHSFKFAVTDGLATTQGVATIEVQYWNGNGIRPDVLEWIYANNPGLKNNFLETEPPDRRINLPGGDTIQIYRLDQFLNQNFDIDLKSRRMEKVNYVENREWRMRRLMALPEFYHFILEHRDKYQIGGLGTVSALQAYNYFRNIHKTVWVTATGNVNAPVGGGNGINAPSWAVWNQMNLLFHEMCHVINIGHNSGGLSGPLAGKMRDWENQGRFNYSTVNLNSLTIWQ